MTFVLPPSIINISLFGSGARKDDDANSDLDVLVVVANGSGKTSPESVRTLVEREFGKVPSLSWYGLRKIRSLFDTGDLFAWHLHLEAKTLAGTKLQSLLGSPSNYTAAISDIKDLRGIAGRVDNSIRNCSANAVFELGILYVCARNIAMSASWRLTKAPSFGRYSPYDLPIDFPIACDLYQKMMDCRMASQRGRSPPIVSAVEVLEAQNRIMLWSESVLVALAKMEAVDE